MNLAVVLVDHYFDDGFGPRVIQYEFGLEVVNEFLFLCFDRTVG
jgi:hypothetical protein